MPPLKGNEENIQFTLKVGWKRKLAPQQIGTCHNRKIHDYLLLDYTFQVELWWSDGHDPQMAIHGDELAILKQINRIGDAVDTRDAEFPGDDGAVDKHAAAPLDNRRGQGHQVCHGWLNSVANQHLSGVKVLQVFSAPHGSYSTGCQTGACRLADKLPRCLACSDS